MANRSSSRWFSASAQWVRRIFFSTRSLLKMKRPFQRGDIVLVVRVDYDYQKWMIGRVLQLRGRRHTGSWDFEDAPMSSPDGDSTIVGVYDHEIILIDNPKGKDETLRWKKVPSKELVT